MSFLERHEPPTEVWGRHISEPWLFKISKVVLQTLNVGPTWLSAINLYKTTRVP